ncbi:MAG: chromosomal replication initiator protein DnaA [Candidatus Dojkabacteria bacterium]
MPGNNLDYKDIWKKTLAQIEVKLDNPTQFNTWFLHTNLIEVSGKKATVAVRNSYSADWLRRKHQIMIEQTLGYVAKKEGIEVEYKISEELTKSVLVKGSLGKVGEDSGEGNRSRSSYGKSSGPSLLDLEGGESAQIYTVLQQAKINPKWRFENLVVGEANQMAHAAALAIAESPGQVYNPYFIYGGTGLGKTHMAHAVATRIIERDIEKKIVYISAEGFMNEMVRAIQTGKNIKFREKYRKSADLLIIDDIQFISNWEKTQTEFFNTFNVLQADGKQIIIISDRPPEELNNLEARLKSRFQGGIVVEIQRPDYEHRLAILRRKMEQTGQVIPEKFVNYLAENVTDNVRELEGALQKVVLLNNLARHELSIEEVAKQLGKDARAKRKVISVQQIIKKVAKEFEVSSSDIKGSRRTADIALARQVCMYIFRQELGYKLEEIARFLNRKDHTTIMHGIQRVADKRAADEVFRDQIINLIEKLSE